MSMSIAEATAATPRGLIHYADAGEGSPVLSLHGAMGGTDQGMILARVTGADAGRIIAPARPGYPGTPLSSGRTPEAQADLYVALLDHLGLDRVAVIAVSGGGASALMFALRHPGRCRGLVLVSTCAGPQPMPIPRGFGLMGMLARWPAFVGWMKGRAVRNPDKVSVRSIPDPEHQRALRDDTVAMPLYRQLRAGMFDRLAERLPGTENDIRTTRSQFFALEEIGVPTLVVHGTRDPLLPYEKHGAELARRIQGAEMLTVGEGGHAAIFTHRALIAPHVAGFLAAL